MLKSLKCSKAQNHNHVCVHTLSLFSIIKNIAAVYKIMYNKFYQNNDKKEEMRFIVNIFYMNRFQNISTDFWVDIQIRNVHFVIFMWGRYTIYVSNDKNKIIHSIEFYFIWFLVRWHLHLDMQSENLKANIYINKMPFNVEVPSTQTRHSFWFLSFFFSIIIIFYCLVAFSIQVLLLVNRLDCW